MLLLVRSLLTLKVVVWFIDTVRFRIRLCLFIWRLRMRRFFAIITKIQRLLCLFVAFHTIFNGRRRFWLQACGRYNQLLRVWLVHWNDWRPRSAGLGERKSLKFLNHSLVGRYCLIINLFVVVITSNLIRALRPMWTKFSGKRADGPSWALDWLWRLVNHLVVECVIDQTTIIVEVCHGHILGLSLRDLSWTMLDSRFVVSRLLADLLVQLLTWVGWRCQVGV